MQVIGATNRHNAHKTMANDDFNTFTPNINSPLVNPFRTCSHDEMNQLIESFIEKTEINNIYREYIQKGAFLAQDKTAFDGPRADGLKLKPDELEILKREDPRTGNKWNQPWILYALVACCSLGAAVQGKSDSRSPTSFNHLLQLGWDEVSRFQQHGPLVSSSNWIMKLQTAVNGGKISIQRKRLERKLTANHGMASPVVLHTSLWPRI